MLAAAPALLAAAALQPAAHAVPSAEDGFSIEPPQGWVRAEGTASGVVATRKVVVFHPPNDLETNVNIITTLASVELTKLGSLGSAYEFGFRLVTSQDRRGRRSGAQVAELLSAEERDGYYIVEYTIQRPDDGVDRHLVSLVGLRFDGMYNKLYTVTGQYRAGDAAQFGAMVKDAVTSFRYA